MDTNKFGVVSCLDKDEGLCCGEDVVVCLDEVVVACLDKNNQDGFYLDLSFHTPWNRFLRKPWVGNVYSTMII